MMIINDSEALLQAPKKSKELWRDIRKLDYTTNGMMNYKLTLGIFKKYKHMFNDFLKLTSVEDLFKVVD
jgi:hypothetical protein